MVIILFLGREDEIKKKATGKDVGEVIPPKGDISEDVPGHERDYLMRGRGTGHMA
jgi:hypothetical protein